MASSRTFRQKGSRPLSLLCVPLAPMVRTALVGLVLLAIASCFAMGSERAWADDGSVWHDVASTGLQADQPNGWKYDLSTGTLIVTQSGVTLHGDSLNDAAHDPLYTIQVDSSVTSLTLNGCTVKACVFAEGNDFTLSLLGDNAVSPMAAHVGGRDAAIFFEWKTDDSSARGISGSAGSTLSVTAPDGLVGIGGERDIFVRDANLALSSPGAAALYSKNGAVTLGASTIVIEASASMVDAAAGIDIDQAKLLHAYDANGTNMDDAAPIEHQGRYRLEGGGAGSVASTGSLVPAGITSDGQKFAYYLVGGPLVSRFPDWFSDYKIGAYLTGRDRPVANNLPQDVVVPPDIKGLPVVSVQIRDDLRMTSVSLDAAKATIEEAVVRGNPSLQGGLGFDGCSSLTLLDVSENPKLGTLAVRNAANLKTLDCFQSGLTSLVIENLPMLDQLSCMDNKLTALDVSQAPNMTALDCEGNQLKELDVSGNPKIELVNARRNSLERVELAGSLPQTNLGTIDFSDNELAGLDISQCPNLVDVYLTDNQLTALDFATSRPRVMGDLYVNGNRLTQLDLSPLERLESLYCENNASASGERLAALDLSSFKDTLFELSCGNNAISTLDLAGFSELSVLKCAGNKLTTLDLSGCVDLVEANCSNNGIATLSLTGCTSLRNLDCSTNKLDVLSIAGCDSLRLVRCSDNYLYDTTALETWGAERLHVLDLGTQHELPLVTIADEGGSGTTLTARFSFDSTPRLLPLDPDSSVYQGLRHGGTVLAAVELEFAGRQHGPVELSVPAKGYDGVSMELYSYNREGAVQHNSSTAADGHAVFTLSETTVFLAEVAAQPSGLPVVGDRTALLAIATTTLSAIALAAVCNAARRLRKRR